MADAIYTVVLDLTDDGCIETGWRLKQGDSGLSKIVAKVVNNGVDVYDPNVTPDIAFKRADGNSVLSTMTANDGYYEYTFVGNEISVAGRVVMDVKFTDAESRISTCSARFEVLPDPMGYDPEGAHTYDNPVSELVAQATAAAETAIDSSFKAEGFAVGEQGGVPVEEDSPYYQNNAKYYADYAADFIKAGTKIKTNTTGQFETSTGGILQSCNINLEPVQSGSGTPSPSNVRQITGHASVEVTLSDAEDTVIEDITVALGDTYYGGTLDVVSGKLTITHARVDLGSYTWNKTGTNLFFAEYPRDFKKAVYVNGSWYANGDCECYKFIQSLITTEDGVITLYFEEARSFYRLFVNDSNRYTWSASDFKTAVTGQYLVYELATPLTIQLTPQQIETLIGQNNVSVPLTGQSLDSLTYREVMAWDDVERAVNVKLDLSSVAPIEYTDKASQSYNQKQLFIKDNKLCQALASISSGASFTENTNFKYTTLAEIIEPLL